MRTHVCARDTAAPARTRMSKWGMSTVEKSAGLREDRCVCVCVCERERERERGLRLREDR